MFKILNILSIYFNIFILHIFFGDKKVEKLCKYKKNSLALKIVVKQIHLQQRQYSLGPTIIIAGVARTGKSILAKMIAQERNYLIINMDRYRYIWNVEHLNINKRIELKKYFIHQITRPSGYGLIIEGDELITDDMPDLRKKIISHSITFQYLLDIKNTNDAIVVLIGSSNTSIKEKTLGILESAKEHGCWAAENMDINNVLKLSEVIISMSQEISILSEKLNLIYLDIKPQNFNKEIIHVKNKIESILY